jgi:AcrR family transcriptional regulator
MHTDEERPARPSAEPEEPEEPEGRVARNRRRRTEAFLAAGLRIVTDEGIEALTMARLAQELDTAVGSVYRYFGSKGELMAAVEADAIDQLRRSHDEHVPAVVAAVAPQVAEPEVLVRLVVLGRWFCAAADRHPQEVRLLQLISARRSSSVEASALSDLVPAAMSLVLNITGAIDDATRAGVLREGGGLGRAIMWLTAVGGVFVADELERHVPEVLGGGRLIRQLNVDLFVGWGAPLDAIERIESAIDALDGSPPLA